jgi:hypothetical protein
LNDAADEMDGPAAPPMDAPSNRLRALLDKLYTVYRPGYHQSPPNRLPEQWANWVKALENEAIRVGTLDRASQSANKRGLRDKRAPLSERARLFYDKLASLKPQEALTLPRLLNGLPASISEAVFYRDLKPELEAWGMRNKPKVGYYLERE